jgi:uncharacterized membrane protein YjjP (DUF1212 family)
MGMTDEEFDQACQFIIELGTLGHRYGLASSYLESYLSQLPDKLGFSGHVLATPKWLDFIFWRTSDQQQHRHFKPLPAVSYNLSKLASIGQLLHQFRHGHFSTAESITRLQQIDGQAPPYGNAMVGLGYGLAGLGFAVLLSAAWWDVALAGLLSLVVYGVVLLAGRWAWLASRLEVISALMAAVIAYGLALLVFPGSNAFIVTLCAVVVLIPGLALTVGVGEVAAKSVLSGTSRLLDGIVITLKLYLGAALGAAIVNAIHPVPAVAPVPPIAAGVQWLFVLILIFGIGLVFQVRPRDLGWAVLAGALAYGGTKLGGAWGLWQGSFLGALFLGCYAYLFAWARQLPTAVVWLPGIMILVPGAATYLGINTLETSGVASGLVALGGVMVQLGAIVGGLVTLLPSCRQRFDLGRRRTTLRGLRQSVHKT